MLELSVNFVREFMELVLKFFTTDNASTVLAFAKDVLAELTAVLQ